MVYMKDEITDYSTFLLQGTPSTIMAWGVTTLDLGHVWYFLFEWTLRRPNQLDKLDAWC